MRAAKNTNECPTPEQRLVSPEECGAAIVKLQVYSGEAEAFTLSFKNEESDGDSDSDSEASHRSIDYMRMAEFTLLGLAQV